MIKWRSIKEFGYPTDTNKKYLVTDGKDISTSVVTNYFNTVERVKKLKFTGDDNTYEDNSCCSGTQMFDLTETHWCPIDELNLPT